MTHYTIKTITKKVIDSPFTKGKCYQYRIEIEHNGKKARFTYHDSVYNYQRNNKLDYNDVLYSVISDSRAYSETKDISDFCIQFGCEKDTKAYKGCEENYYKLNSLFSDKEIEELEKELQEKGY